MTLPSDNNSLLVPMAMDAWVNASTNTQNMAFYYADYNNLQDFASPIPAPFSNSSDTPANGIHLHWALPDALTHGVQNSDGSFAFPLVPNRWLVVRIDTSSNPRAMPTAWVIKSDGQQPTGTAGAGPGAFLDPNNPSGISADGSTVAVNGINLGITVPIKDWQGDANNTSPLFLQAVGPGNISFAAYKPFVENVFSIVDTDLPAEDSGSYSFSYLVVGWFSNPAGDPLAGVDTYVDGFTPSCWDSQDDWQNQTAQERFSAILAAMQWSLPSGTDLPDTPPAASLYHSFIADVAWPPNYNNGFFNGMNPGNVQIAVGNNAIDALAALIQSYANNEGAQDPSNSAQWITAGNTLCNLIQAASLNLLEDYGVPGGSAQVQKQIEQSWFGSDPGGTVWEVVSALNNLQVDTANDTLTPAQNSALLQQLSQLNRDQRAYDLGQCQLQAQQSELYRLWLKLSQSINMPWDLPTTYPDFSTVLQPVLQNKIYPSWFGQVANLLNIQSNLLAALPEPDDNDAANAWANANWVFPDITDPGVTVSLQDLGLQLKAAPAQPYWHPADPVVLVKGAGRGLKYGEDGSFNAEGTLCCRLPGQTVTGLNVADVSITAAEYGQVAAFTAPSAYLSQYPAAPSIVSLLVEVFFSDPNNAAIINEVTPSASVAAINSAITSLLTGGSAGSWSGTPPSPIGYSLWQQAWSPILLEWKAKYYPTLTAKRNFDLSSWTFDGTHYQWNGNGFDYNNVYSIPIQGRTVVTPYAQTVFQAKLSNYLSTADTIDTVQMQELLAAVMGWDILGQTLSGFTDQLTTLLAQETFPPPCSPSPGATPALVGDLVQDQYHLTPQLTNPDLAYENIFFPVRGGLVTFARNQLWLLDSYGQYYDLSQANTEYGFQPILSPSLTVPSGVTIPSFIPQPFVLGPRLVQSARLDMTVLANDTSGGDILTSANNNPVCGWLLPNYLDNSIVVYDSNGIMLGELLVQQAAPDNWRPRPGPNGDNPPPPASPAQIANPSLQNVISALASQNTDTLSDFMQITDETLWMVNPANGGGNNSLAALIGRPLAVVALQLNFTLNGDPLTNQQWNAMLDPTSTLDDYTLVQDSGGVLEASFPVRLGSLDLRDDGLVGYFLPNYKTFYAIHTEFELNPSDTFIQPILETSGVSPVYQGDVAVTPNSATGVVLTLILDPQGSVHAYTGILPVNTVALDANTVADFLRNVSVNFQAGPILADADTLRTPQPASNQGTWNWLQAIGDTWEQDGIVDADDAARFPTQAPTLREGWLQLLL